MPESSSKSALSFGQFEHAGWQTVAGGYDDYFGRLTRQTIEPLLDAVGAGPGRCLLDVACGPGYVAAAATARGAHVTAVDFSSVMVSRARKTYPDIEFREGDAQNLDFQDSAFDCIVMNFGLLHLADPERAVSECRRVLLDGGRFAFSVWATPERSRGFQIVLSAIEAYGNPSVPLPQGPPFFRFSDAVECRRVLSTSGFGVLDITTLPLVWRLDAPEDLFKAFYLGTPRTGGLLRAQREDDLRAIERAVTEEARSYSVDGGVEVPMAAVVAVAAK